MALESPKYERMFSESGSDDDKITDEEKEFVKLKFDENDYLKDKHKLESQGHLIYILDQLTQELDYLRTKILANESCCAANTGKTTITTGQASAITANTAKRGISTSQTSAITANTAKTGISTRQATAITANTAKVSLTALMSGTGTVLSFGEMITTPPPKGSNNPTYSIVMTAVKGIGKAATTKSVTLTLI